MDKVSPLCHLIVTGLDILYHSGLKAPSLMYRFGVRYDDLLELTDRDVQKVSLCLSHALKWMIIDRS